MTAQEIIKEIRPLGSDSYKKILLNHGVKEPCLGVKIGDLKKIQKRIKKDYQLALDLYDTGVYDAMYLAGMIADDVRMTKRDLQRWADKAYGAALGTAVSSVAAGSSVGYELAMEWIESKKRIRGGGRLADVEQHCIDQGRRGTGYREIEAAVAARAEDDSPGSERGALYDELIRHLRRELRAWVDGSGTGNRREDRSG